MAETPEVCNHLHLPLQSGSDAILVAMRRGYTAERYLDRLAAARAAVDDLAVTTDLIVGFPGETEEDFERTLEVAAEAEFDSAYTFVFSPRPGTRAAAMEDRFLPGRGDGRAHGAPAGRRRALRPAPPRGPGRPGRGGAWSRGRRSGTRRCSTGRTGQNKLVHFAAPGGRPAARPPAPTPWSTVTGAARHHLTGELVEVTARPSHRVRIPVTAG